MNKKYLFTFILILSLCLCACSDNEQQNNNKNQDNQKQTDSLEVKDEESDKSYEERTYEENVFTNDIFDGVESVTFYDFDETKYTTYDKEIINELVNMLVTAKLIRLTEDEYVEGSYMISLNKPNEMIDIGLGSVMGYDGNQYRADNITDEQIYDIVTKIRAIGEKVSEE